MIAATAKVGLEQQTLTWFQNMEESGIKPNVTLYNTLIELSAVELVSSSVFCSHNSSIVVVVVVVVVVLVIVAVVALV